MKTKLLYLIPYAVALAAIFYLLPITINDTGTGMFVLLLFIPVLVLVCSVIYGIRQGFDFLLPICVFVLFAPTVYIFYNSSAWIYVAIYLVIAFAGNGIGRIFYKKK